MRSSTTIWHLILQPANPPPSREREQAEPKGLLILAHLSLFLFQLIKVLIRLILTPSGNDGCAAGEAVLGTLHTLREAGGWRTSPEGWREVEEKVDYFQLHLSAARLLKNA